MLSSMLTDTDIANLNLIWKFVTYGHMTRSLLMICVSPPLPQGQPSLCAAALLQSHSYETVPVPVDRYIKMVAT